MKKNPTDTPSKTFTIDHSDFTRFEAGRTKAEATRGPTWPPIWPAAIGVRARGAHRQRNEMMEALPSSSGTWTTRWRPALVPLWSSPGGPPARQVVLSGEGADELFGGYTTTASRCRCAVRAGPGGVRKALGGCPPDRGVRGQGPAAPGRAALSSRYYGNGPDLPGRPAHQGLRTFDRAGRTPRSPRSGTAVRRLGPGARCSTSTVTGCAAHLVKADR